MLLLIELSEKISVGRCFSLFTFHPRRGQKYELTNSRTPGNIKIRLREARLGSVDSLYGCRVGDGDFIRCDPHDGSLIAQFYQ